MSRKIQNTLSDNTNISITLVSLTPMDYKIVDDMKKTPTNINLFELDKI